MRIIAMVIAFLIAGARASLPAEESAPAAEAPEKLAILIVTGQQNHDWVYTSPLMKEVLEWSGRFKVEITADPAKALADPEFAAGFDAFYLDYNGERWGATAESVFLDAVRAGAGVVVVHAANNSFPGWSEYERMTGLGWRDTAGHGSFHAFDVSIIDFDHPITKGLDEFAQHPDELYHGLTAFADAKMRVLMQAHSAKASGGSEKDEPMTMVLEYDGARVFHTTLGHVWPKTPATRASLLDLDMQVLLARGVEWAASGAVTITADAFGEWETLFDGSSTDAWRGFKNENFPDAGWIIRDGALVHEKGGGGGDLITRDVYSDFDLRLEWRIAPGGNSGIMFRVSEKGAATYTSGPEMQVLDDAAHGDGKSSLTSAGSLYGLIASREEAARPAGVWNTSRIRVRGTRLDFWTNGYHTVGIDMASEEWKSLVAASKFSAWPEFAAFAEGHIALQDHGDEVAYRAIKIRRIGQ